MADLDPREVLERAEGAMPRPEFLAELRDRIEREALAQSDGTRTAPADASIVDPVLHRPDGKKRMSKNKWIGLAAAAVVVVIVGLAIFAGGGESASELDTVGRPDESPAAGESEDTTTTATTTTTTTTVPEPTPAPVVERPDPAPAPALSELSFDEWLVELTAFAENRHEGDWLHFVAMQFGEQAAIREGALEQRAGWAFTAQCDLLPVTSSHMAEAPGLPENEAIAEAYQALLDADSASWAFLQAKCDAVDHDEVRAGTALPPSLDTEGDFSSASFGLCPALRNAISEEVGSEVDFICEPPADFAIDRDMPDDFRQVAGN